MKVINLGTFITLPARGSQHRMLFPYLASNLHFKLTSSRIISDRCSGAAGVTVSSLHT